jgi:hypothetical protein
MLLTRFCQDDRVRIYQPRRNLQVKFTRPLGKNDFVAYIDGIGKLEALLLRCNRQILSQLLQFVRIKSPVMINVCLVELGRHISREFLLGDGPIVISVHCGQPLLPSRRAAGSLLTRGSRDTRNSSPQQNRADCPRNHPIGFHNILQGKGLLAPPSYISLEANTVHYQTNCGCQRYCWRQIAVTLIDLPSQFSKRVTTWFCQRSVTNLLENEFSSNTDCFQFAR